MTDMFQHVFHHLDHSKHHVSLGATMAAILTSIPDIRRTFFELKTMGAKKKTGKTALLHRDNYEYSQDIYQA